MFVLDQIWDFRRQLFQESDINQKSYMPKIPFKGDRNIESK